LIELMETCWHQDPEKRKFAEDSYYSHIKKNGGLASALYKLYEKARKGEIKFPENIDASILPTKINDQEIYSSRPLTQFISKAFTLQSMRLNSNVIT
ncbi:29820_t:CDS:1, partial [Racocetra persica]